MTVDFSKIDWFVVGISSGKDSTALLLWLKYYFFPQNNIPVSKLICTFADTGNEADETYEHIGLISNTLHPVIWLFPDLDFRELSYHKKMFPFKQARFCTQQLKLEPTKRYMDEFLTGNILPLNGMRAEESPARAAYNEFAGVNETYHGRLEWRPLLDWKIEHVFAIHKKYNFPLNPLYKKGFSRVGCFPCIVFANKKEVRLLARAYPERIDFLREKESNFPNRNGFYQIFPLNKVPARYRSKIVKNDEGEDLAVAPIDDVVAWSKTTDRKRSSQSDFHYEDFEEEERTCQEGVCE